MARKNGRKKPTRSRRSHSHKTRVANVPTFSAAHGDLTIRARVPGAWMIERPYPLGVPPHDPPRRPQISGFGLSPVFAHVPERERQAIFQSAAKTYAKAAYHESRYNELRAALDRRRENLPGEVFWDGLIEHLHFELQAFAGA